MGFCTVELDAADVKGADLGTEYLIPSVPTLLSIVEERAQFKTMVTDASKLEDPEFLVEWIRTEAARGKDDQDAKKKGSDSITGIILIDVIINWLFW